MDLPRATAGAERNQIIECPTSIQRFEIKKFMVTSTILDGTIWTEWKALGVVNKQVKDHGCQNYRTLVVIESCLKFLKTATWDLLISNLIRLSLATLQILMAQLALWRHRMWTKVPSSRKECWLLLILLRSMATPEGQTVHRWRRMSIIRWTWVCTLTEIRKSVQARIRRRGEWPTSSAL